MNTAHMKQLLNIGISTEELNVADSILKATVSYPTAAKPPVNAERDASRLVYFGFRYYSPVLCRWISEDPIRERGGLNLYQFCGNSPVNFRDPWGLKTYGLIVISAGIGVGPAAFEGGQMHAVDFQTGDVHSETMPNGYSTPAEPVQRR